MAVVIDDALMDERDLEFESDAVTPHECDERVTSCLRPCG